MVAMPAEQVINADGRARMLNPVLIQQRIAAELKQTKFKDISSKRFAVLLPFNINRRSFMDDVVRIFREESASVRQVPGHSLGGVFVGDYVVFAKPEGRQTTAGIQNENVLVENINRLTSGGKMNVEFSGGGTIFKVEGVVEARGVGRETGGGRKADVQLTTDGPRGTISLSLKMDNADRWESVDSWYPEMGGQQLLDDAMRYKNVRLAQLGSIFQMRDSRSGAKVNVAGRASKQQAELVVFGSDIMPHGAVIVKTFSGTDFEVSEDGGTIKIKATRIINSKRSLKKDEVWFLLTNSSTRTGSRIRPGIRAEAVTGRRASRSGIRKV
jgi:hypothetical protein